MTLKFKNYHEQVDMRREEYDGAMITLGFRRAEVEKEFDRVQQNLLEIMSQRDDVVKEIASAKDELVTLESRKTEIQNEIADIVSGASNRIAEFRAREKESKEIVDGKSSELQTIEGYLVSLNVKIEERNAHLKDLDSAFAITRKSLDEVTAELSEMKRERDGLNSGNQVLYQLQLSVKNKLTALQTEFQELEWRVSVLRNDNKEGLDLTASFEGERKRLQEKDDFLRRKEADLLIYENRLQKRMDDAGIKTTMIFK